MSALNYLDYYSPFFLFGFYYYSPFFPFGFYYYDFPMYKPATDRKIRFILNKALKRGIDKMLSIRDLDSVLDGDDDEDDLV